MLANRPLTVTQLLRERKGDVAYRELSRPASLARLSDAAAVATLARYADQGAVDFCRAVAVSLLVDAVTRPDPELAMQVRGGSA
jgi:hypothetical protein